MIMLNEPNEKTGIHLAPEPVAFYERTNTIYKLTDACDFDFAIEPKSGIAPVFYFKKDIGSTIRSGEVPKEYIEKEIRFSELPLRWCFIFIRNYFRAIEGKEK